MTTSFRITPPLIIKSEELQKGTNNAEMMEVCE